MADSIAWYQPSREFIKLLKPKLRGPAVKTWQSPSRKETQNPYDVTHAPDVKQSSNAEDFPPTIKNNGYVYNYVSLSQYPWALKTGTLDEIAIA